MPTEYIRIAKTCKDCPLVFSCWNHLLLPLGIRNFTTHLLTCSHSLERFYWNRFSFIGILILPSTIFHHLPPSSTTERWGNDGANGDLAVITFNSWPCQRRKRMENIEVQTHDILGVPYQANPALWICTIFVSVPPWSSMYCVCMYMHISWNIETYVNKDTCRHVHVNRHLRVFSHFWWLHMWLHVTSCDYHVSWSLVHR